MRQTPRPSPFGPIHPLILAAALVLLPACGDGDGASGDDAEATGRLVIVGGSLDSDNEAVWEAFVEGREGDGPLCVVPTASGVPESSMESAVSRIAEEVGPEGVQGVFITTENPASADSAAVVERLGGCSGYWFTGGVQSRVLDVFRPEGIPTAADSVLRERFRAGAVIGGSSAGAAMMPTRMIAGGGSEGALLHGVRTGDDGDGVRLEDGMGLIDRGLIDQHFLARGRVGRLVVAVLAGEGGGVGFGIDENTALITDGDSARVAGESGVLMIDAREATQAGRGGEGVRLHLLGPGDRVDLSTLESTLADGKQPLEQGGAVSVPEDPFDRWAFLHLMAELSASSEETVETTAADSTYRIRLSKGDAFRAVSSGGDVPGPQDTPGGLSAGPFVLDVVPMGAGATGG